VDSQFSHGHPLLVGTHSMYTFVFFFVWCDIQCISVAPLVGGECIRCIRLYCNLIMLRRGMRPAQIKIPVYSLQVSIGYHVERVVRSLVVHFR
jgi:hypothetical protein